MAQREGWQSRIGIIMAVAGSAVGLGNFLRFPGQAAQNGGGAFMLPYFAALLLLGIPLGWAEWTMGRYGGVRGFNSAPGIFAVIWRRPIAKYFGMPALLIPLVVYMYYIVIEAWCLAYAWNYVTGDLLLGDDPERYAAYFDEFVGKRGDGALLSAAGTEFLVILVVAFSLNFVLIYRGLGRGIETFCNWAMPVLFLLAVIVLVRVLTLDAPDASRPEQNLVNGLGFMWNPDGDKLWEPATWLAAAGQIFFTLGVGFGIIINYSSYLRPKDDVVLSGLTASAMNEISEVCLGGLITIPAAFMFLGPSIAGMGTFDLGFKALPNVFAQMDGGRVFGALWFFMLFLAAIMSSVAMLQPVIAFFEEGLGLQRHASAALLGLITAFGCGYVVYFSKNSAALDTMDFWVGTFLIVCLTLFQSILYGWIFGIERGAVEAHRGAQMRIPTFVQWILKYLTPVYLVAMLGAFVVGDVVGLRRGESGWEFGTGAAAALLHSPVALSTMLFISVTAAFLLVLIHAAGRRWEAAPESPLRRAEPESSP